jgi:hypothetical protein
MLSEFVVLGVTADGVVAKERNLDGGRRVFVRDGVDPVATVQGVAVVAADERVVVVAAVECAAAGTADERVVAVPTDEVHGVGVALQPIVVIRADKVLDAAQRVALGIAAGGEADNQRDAHGRVRLAVGRLVPAIAAVERVAVVAADEVVVVRRRRKSLSLPSSP